MKNHQDYTTRKGIGIRLTAEGCRTIREIRGEWQEIGPLYKIPVEPALLNWTPPGIPPGVLAVALRVFELDYPGTRMRCLLTTNDGQQRGQPMNQSLSGRRELQQRRA
jgi:hypothetical protein